MRTCWKEPKLENKVQTERICQKCAKDVKEVRNYFSVTLALKSAIPFYAYFSSTELRLRGILG